MMGTWVSGAAASEADAGGGARPSTRRGCGGAPRRAGRRGACSPSAASGYHPRTRRARRALEADGRAADRRPPRGVLRRLRRPPGERVPLAEPAPVLFIADFPRKSAASSSSSTPTLERRRRGAVIGRRRTRAACRRATVCGMIWSSSVRRPGGGTRRSRRRRTCRSPRTASFANRAPRSPRRTACRAPRRRRETTTPPCRRRRRHRRRLAATRGQPWRGEPTGARPSARPPPSAGRAPLSGGRGRRVHRRLGPQPDVIGRHSAPATPRSYSRRVRRLARELARADGDGGVPPREERRGPAPPPFWSATATAVAPERVASGARICGRAPLPPTQASSSW